MGLRRGILACLSLIAGSAAWAADPGASTGEPPLRYRLDAVTVTLLRQPGRGAFSIRRLTLPGHGQATLERDGAVHPFPYAPGELLALVNGLYRTRFFSLPDDCTPRLSVVLKDDGTVVPSILRLADAASTKVCFAVDGYEKCVTYAHDSLDGLEQIVQRAFADADRRTPHR